MDDSFFTCQIEGRVLLWVAQSPATVCLAQLDSAELFAVQLYGKVFHPAFELQSGRLYFGTQTPRGETIPKHQIALLC